MDNNNKSLEVNRNVGKDWAEVLSAAGYRMAARHEMGEATITSFWVDGTLRTLVPVIPVSKK